MSGGGGCDCKEGTEEGLTEEGTLQQRPKGGAEEAGRGVGDEDSGQKEQRLRDPARAWRARGHPGAPCGRCGTSEGKGQKRGQSRNARPDRVGPGRPLRASNCILSRVKSKGTDNAEHRRGGQGRERRDLFAGGKTSGGFGDREATSRRCWDGREPWPQASRPGVCSQK